MYFLFFNAEVKNPVLSLSVYAEDSKSTHATLHRDWAWGMLFSANVSKVLSHVACVYLHPDPTDELSGTQQKIRTIGKWRASWESTLLWLECPLPPAASSSSFGHVRLVFACID